MRQSRHEGRAVLGCECYIRSENRRFVSHAQLILNFNFSSDRSHKQQKLAAKSFLSLVTVLWADFWNVVVIYTVRPN